MDALQRQDLIECINRIRPIKAHDAADAKQKIDNEITWLLNNPSRATSMGQSIDTLLHQPRQDAYYAETGMRTSLGFGLEILTRLQDKFLPKKPNERDWGDVVQLIFHKKDDYIWVNAIENNTWLALLDALNLNSSGLSADLMADQLRALTLLSHRLVSIAIDHELLRFDKAIGEPNSPFMLQNELLIPLIRQSIEAKKELSFSEIKNISLILNDCHNWLQASTTLAHDHGITIRATYLLAQSKQILDRMNLLIVIPMVSDQRLNAIRIFKTLLHLKQENAPITHFVGENLELLSRNITDHASQHGEHYIVENKKQWFSMLRSALLGGVIIALMAIIKLEISSLHLPTLTEGLLFGLDYGLGFVLIHLLGGVVATKQPAMTASSIAANIKDTQLQDLHQLVVLIKKVTSAQFIAIVGNILAALPLAMLYFWALQHLNIITPISPEKATHLLDSNDPFKDAILWYAAIAGVGLFFSGLVSGFFDNRARYFNLEERLTVAPFLSWLKQDWRLKLAKRITIHHGAIMGNLFFGLYLGLIAALGMVTGLPLDIRHIAFASANMGIAINSLGWVAASPLLATVIVGIILIGLVNLIVSFSLALWVALQAHKLGFRPFLKLAKLVFKDFTRHPITYFRPPSN